MADIVLNVGDLIMFNTKNINDPNTYFGKVIGLVTFDIAKTLSDVVAYHETVRQQDSSIPSFEDAHYFILQIYDKESMTPIKKQVFATEWIDDATFQRLTSVGKMTVYIYGVDESDKDQILNTIRTALAEYPYRVVDGGFSSF